jgi:hypothetical protein
LLYYYGQTHPQHETDLLLLLPFRFAQKSVESFDSQKLGEKRQITIGLPASYESNIPKKIPHSRFTREYLFEPFYGAHYGAYWDDLQKQLS